MSSEPDSYLEPLRELSRTGEPHYLVGGQAVNLWALYFRQRMPDLNALGPFTSKDCDVWVSHQAFEAIEGGLISSSQLERSHSPADGQLGILTLENGLILDLLQFVRGLNKGDAIRANDRAHQIAEIRVIDVLFLFKAKCHNLVGIDQEGRQDWKHLLILKAIIPSYFQELVMECRKGTIEERACAVALSTVGTGTCDRHFLPWNEAHGRK